MAKLKHWGCVRGASVDADDGEGSPHEFGPGEVPSHGVDMARYADCENYKASGMTR